jgi:phenylacetate-CoA ligase
MLEEILPANRFYARRLEDVAWRDGDLAQVLSRLPFTTKQDLVEDQRAHPPYGSNLTYPLEAYTRFSQTSGTSGTPLRWLDTDLSWGWMVERWEEVLRVSGVTASDRILFAFSFGPFLGFWTAFEAGVRLGCLCIPGGGMSSAARLRAILQNDVSVLCCTPTYALRLAEAAAEEGLSLRESPVRLLITAGEPGACIPATRARLQAAWPGARVRDQHGMTEVGPVTLECPVREGVLHVMEEGFIPEVIDPESGQPAASGERGELVLTGLGRWASPLIRYRTGDLVQPAATAPCACGRYDLALEGGILGRTDDMVIVRSVNLYPSAVEAVLREFGEVIEYRVEIDARSAMTEMRVLVEPTPGCADPVALARAVEEALRTAFHLRVPVSPVAPGTLPRFELKARRWIRDPCSST